jgi:hypothetical protein
VVVVHDLNVLRIALTPRKADAPLVVDSDTVTPRAIAFQEFKLISRRHAKIFQPQRPMQVQQLPPSKPFNGLKSPNPAILKEQRGIGALERPDQVSVYDV